MSGEYALLVRYHCVGVGADLEQWELLVVEEQERLKRHQAIRDTLISPDGALTATMLPHLTGLMGIIAVNRTVGRAPLYSPLEEDFRERLLAMHNDSLQLSSFDTVDAFYHQMNHLIKTSKPARLARWNQAPPPPMQARESEENA
jgi:hypothetical protein